MTKSKQLRQAFSWQPDGNIWTNLGANLKRVVALREGGLTQGWIRSAFHFGRYVESLQRSQGWRGVVVHLKGCHVLLQQVVGGQLLDNPRRLGCAIARSRTGLPRVIPVVHRQQILSGDTWAVKIWSSFFWLYRVLEIPGRLKIKTITAPAKENYLVVVDWCRFLTQFLPVFLQVIGLPEKGKELLSKRRSLLTEEESSTIFHHIDKEIDLVEALTAFLLPSLDCELKKIPRKEWKALMKPIITELQPRALMLLNSGPNSAKGPDEGPGAGRTSTGSILTDMSLWANSKELWGHIRKLWPLGAAFAQSLMAQAMEVLEQMHMGGYINFLPMEQGWTVDPLYREDPDEDACWRSNPLLGFSYPRGLGKLSFIPEPAGKIRVVAMVDSLTQMLLRPLHDAVFEILRKIPQDGTFDQYAPARRLASERVMTLWSYDLSAATDRFPVSLQQALLGYLIGPRVARAWRELLTSRDYMVPRQISGRLWVPQGTPLKVRYNAGQPMGAYTSWAVFALSHHLLVQYSAYQAFGTLKWFTSYCLLGDDVVIGNEAVAQKYLLLLQAIGVEVGLAKSLISRRGVFEFAKRTFRVSDEGALVDLSGVSLAAIAAAITDSSVMEELLTRANVRSPREGLLKAARVLGLGFRARSSLGGKLELLNSRLVGLYVLLTRPSSIWGLTPIDWLLQVTVGVRGFISNDNEAVLMDAVRQRLVDSALKIAESLLSLVKWLNVPGPDEIEPSKVPRMPFALKPKGTPLYREFLRVWAYGPFVRVVTRNLRELLDDLKLWTEGNTSDGNFSLDEIYLKINSVISELSSMKTEVDLFIRRDTEKSTARRHSRQRSRIVKFWKATRKVVLSMLEA